MLQYPNKKYIYPYKWKRAFSVIHDGLMPFPTMAQRSHALARKQKEQLLPKISSEINPVL